MTEEERALQRARSDEEWRKMRLEMRREQDRLHRKEREREKMTPTEEWPDEAQKLRAEMVRQAMIGMDQKPSFAKRMEYLEADASAQRTAITRLERALDNAAIVVTVFGFCFLVLVLALGVMT